MIEYEETTIELTSDQILGGWPPESVNIVFTGLALMAMNHNSPKRRRLIIEIVPEVYNE